LTDIPSIYKKFNSLFGVFLFLNILSLSLPVFSEEQNDSRRFRLGLTLDEIEAEEKLNGQETPEEEGNFNYTLENWKEMIQAIEDGREPGTPLKPVVVSTVTAEPPKPPPGLLQVELPYESSLSITGRKIIKVDITNTRITKDRAQELGTKQDTQSFNMEQELQARIQGTVARKTTINVNFDDTKENVKDFSVVYKGDPDEVVQEAAFGDIVLSLPSTEFVNYSKQLFGIRTALKYKKFGLLAIGSRTKGTTETKRFTGQSTRQQVFVNDTNYIRFRFYDLTFSTSTAMRDPGAPFDPLSGRVPLPINGAQQEEVYIEDTTGLNPLASDFDVATPTAPATTIRIRMRQLSPGVDYSIDRIKGIITFTTSIAREARVAVDFTLSSGERLQSLIGGNFALLIKDREPETPQVSQEIKRFYTAGSRNIVRDNGLGNFILKVLDNNRETEIGNSLIPLQRYPDTISMDFEKGIFELQSILSQFPDVYQSNVNSGSPLHAVFSVEFQSIVRTFTLRPNIVLQSETVEVNGRKVNRDLDYFIDYDIGIITFFNDDLIRESTAIEITYEFAPFGGVLGETLVGARGTYDIFTNKKLGMVGIEGWTTGSTLLYNFAAKPTGPPDVRATPSSLLVTEGDTILTGLTFGTLPLKTNLKLEAARSLNDPNLFGRAIVDSMEGIKQEDSSSLIEEAWFPSANPVSGASNLVSDFRGRENGASHLRWADTDVFTSDPNDGSTSQKALNVAFSLNTESGALPEQVSLVNVVSLAGRDFSKKTTLEVEIEGAGSAGAGVEMQIEYGIFNEDADGDGTLDTEDEIPLDGVLNLGEDIGYAFNGAGGDLVAGNGDDTVTFFGSGNTRLDAEDLDNNKNLNTSDLPVTFQPLFLISQGRGQLATGEAVLTQDLSFSGRKLFQIPLNISSLSETEKSRFASVKQVRVTIRNSNAGVSKSGSVNLVRLAVVGNTYEPAIVYGSVQSTMTVLAINNKDNGSSYISLIGNPDYNNLYKGATPTSDTREQALALDYDLAPGSSGTTKNVYSTPRDFSKHDFFKFFVNREQNSCGAGCGGKLFIQAGSETDYQQITIDLSGLQSGPWTLIKIKQSDVNNDGTPDTWVSESPLATVSQSGTVPNLNQISQLKMGILNDTAGNIASQVWINELHLVDPHERTGHAKKYSFDTSWPGWGDLGGSYRDVDRNWQTPTTVIANRDSTSSNSYLNFNRISFLPMSFKNSRDKTITPSAFRSNQNALVSFLEEGKEERINNSMTAKLIIPKMPQVDFSYSDNSTENTESQRNEDTTAVNVGATYAPKTTMDILPSKMLSFRPVPNSITYSYSRRTSKLRFPGLEKLTEFTISTAPFTSTNLTQFSDENEARLAFKPWDGFTFNPTYKVKTESEKRDFREDEIQSLSSVGLIDGRKTPRSLSQSVSAAGSLRLLKWLEPRYNYSFSGTETNGLPTLSSVTAYTTKTITRNSQGEVTGTLQISQILPNFKPTQSMNINTSYKLENGDTYSDMPEGFSWRGKLWVGRPLIETSTGSLARRTDATDRRTFRAATTWQPWSAYKIENLRLKPLGTTSLTSNYLLSKEDSETTGTTKRVLSLTFPDLILTMNDVEDFFGIRKNLIDNSRLVLKNNKRKTETVNVSKNEQKSWGSDYTFQYRKKYEISTSYNQSHQREDNLITNTLTGKTDVVGYSVQTRIPWRVWAFTPRYESNKTESRDSVRLTNDLKNDIYSLQIYGDITKPVGIRFGRKEIGLANRFILNSTVKWDKKRSNVNPGTNYLDVYSGTVSGDYTISQNFRMAMGADLTHEAHHPEFKKLDRTSFGINSTLTIQF
jgi:hypothetical protein